MCVCINTVVYINSQPKNSLQSKISIKTRQANLWCINSSRVPILTTKMLIVGNMKMTFHKTDSLFRGFFKFFDKFRVTPILFMKMTKLVPKVSTTALSGINFKI